MTNAPATSPMSRAQISRAISLFLMFGFSQLAGPSVDPPALGRRHQVKGPAVD